jgi:hypothetical protein
VVVLEEQDRQMLMVLLVVQAVVLQELEQAGMAIHLRNHRQVAMERRRLLTKVLVVGLRHQLRQLMEAVAVVEQVAREVLHLAVLEVQEVLVRHLPYQVLALHMLAVAVAVPSLEAAVLLAAGVVVRVRLPELLLKLVVPELQILAVEGEVAEVAQEQVLLAVQAAPALLSWSTPYQAKLYLRSKALLLGNARQVLPLLTILLLLAVVEVVKMAEAVAVVVVEQVDIEQEQVWVLQQGRNIQLLLEQASLGRQHQG